MKERHSARDKSPLDSGDDVPKLSFGSSVLSNGSSGFHVNLLANSLTTKLKQLRHTPQNGATSSIFSSKAKPPKHPSKAETTQKVMKSILAKHDSKENEYYDRIRSSASSRRSESVPSLVLKEPVSYRSRADSASSDTLPIASARSKASKTTSRRSSSAGQIRVASSRTDTIRAHSEMRSSSRNRLRGSRIGFESRRADSSVMVVKRDGVFKPVDKYAAGRHVLREMGPAHRGAMCDYEMYVLPYSCEDNATLNVQQATSQNFGDEIRRRMKVSWNVIEDTDSDMLPGAEMAECQPDGNTAPSTPANNQRAVSTDNFAFRRPIYSSGRSKVTSIGLKWKMPTVPTEASEKKEKTQKPMWSWLVTQDSKQQMQQHKARGGQLVTSYAPPSGSAMHTVTALNVRNRHSRDVHPVSTAMNREGTSVSRTKWKVPSSTVSTLDAERAVMGRLELVKRPGSRLLYEQGMNGTNSSAAHKYKDTILAETDTEKQIREEFKFMIKKGGKSDVETDETIYASTRRDDQNSSPTKSRSTFY